MATNVYGNGTNSTAGANSYTHMYDRAGIKSAGMHNVYGQYADRRSLKKGQGKTYKVSKYEHMYDRSIGAADFATKGYLSGRSITDMTNSLASAVVTEGMGEGNERSVTKITVSTDMVSYGEMLKYTDEVEMFSEDSMIMHYHEEMGSLAGSRNEDLIQQELLTTPTVLYPSSATSNSLMGATQASGADDSDYKVSFDLIRKSAQKLVRNRAKANTKLIDGSVKVGTVTVNAGYQAIVDAQTLFDLQTVQSGSVALNGKTTQQWYPVDTYAAAGNRAQGEQGKIADVRFIQSESAVHYEDGAVPPQNYVGNLNIVGATDLTSAVAADRGNFTVHPILFPTEGSFATVGLKGHGKIKFNSVTPGVITTTNPFGTKGFYSYRFWFAGIILKEEALLKTLVCVSR